MIDRVSIGSAAIAPALLEEIRRLLPNARIDLPYGMSEVRIAFMEPVAGRSQRRFAAVSPALELAVVDGSGVEVRVGTGELVLRGPALMLGYVHDSAAERERRVREGFRTRDLVECTASGEWFLVGRADGVIDVGGEKVFPAEVEAALLSHPQVRDARVVAADDPEGVRGQVPRADIVADGPLSQREIVNHCRQRLEPYKVPRIIELVGAIERNELGKVGRRA
jgi:acyl-CoA synthetase (AMP-forming)/AMP-acid ligase II